MNLYTVLSIRMLQISQIIPFLTGLGDQVKMDKMNRTCSTHNENENKCTENFGRNPQGKWNRDSSVGIVLRYGLDGRGSRIRFTAGIGNFSLHHSVQSGSGAHPASYLMGISGSFLGGRAAGA
jgi:hypothetical protein